MSVKTINQGPRVTPSSNEFDFKLVTQKPWGVPLASRQRPKRFTAFANLLPKIDADVFTLQETFPTKIMKKSILDPWKKSSTPYFAEGPRRAPLPNLIGSGLTTLTRSQIESTTFLEFEQESGFDALARKGALLTRLTTPEGQTIDVYNVHMQASGQKPNRAHTVRLKQAVELREFIATNSPREHHVIVAGDFNFFEFGAEYLATVNPNQADPRNFIDLGRRLYADPETHPLLTYRYNDPKAEARLDYVFVSPAKGWQVDSDHSQYEVRDLKVSDHNAVLTKIHFKKFPDESVAP